MRRTTVLKRNKDMPHRPLPNCHGGTGALDFTVVLDGKESDGQAVRFLHDDILGPGVSIGVHRHEHEEHYYVLSGRGTMTLDGERVEVGPGDVASVWAGGSHGLENIGPGDMRIIVVGL